MARWLCNNLIGGLEHENQELKEKLAEAELEKVDLQELLEGAKLKRRNLQGDDSRVQVEYEELTRGLDERRFGSETGRTYDEILSTFKLTGGNIKNAALSAAFLAAEPRTDETEAMEDTERETIRELIWEEKAKNGELDLEFLDLVKMDHVIWST